MRFSHIPAPADAAIAALLLALATPAASQLHCNKIIADGHKFDLSPLSGPHSVTVSQLLGPNYHNTTYTTDICRQLKRSEGVAKEEQCPLNTRVCAIERVVSPDGKTDTFSRVFPLAGELKEYGGSFLDAEAINLSTSDSNEDSKKQGVRIILKGGFYKESNGQNRAQRTIIEFICDPDREGTEGEWSSEDKYVPGDDPLRIRFAADGDETTDPTTPDVPIQLGEGKNASLIFDSYGPLASDKDVDVLRLTWKTKYACENRADEPGEDPNRGNHWGFFTWIVILGFLGTATYLIFGSWLNYNRYGARGWDLLPHGDTIRDIPYLMKDWTRSVLNTVQGSGSRGGYSAV